MNYQTIKVEVREPIWFLQFHRPDANNTISNELIAECHKVLDDCEQSATVVVLSGTPDVFCLGADFQAIAATGVAAATQDRGADKLYELWLRLATGPYVTVSHVRGRTNAGGVGFVAASDIVLANETAQFSLSEILFGLYPACVLPFLVRRIGYQRAHYLSLTAQPISARQACEWGLVDACEPASDVLLSRHLQKLRRLSRTAIRRYKSYMSEICMPLRELQAPAVAANVEVFSDPDNLRGITRYVREGVFPWEIVAGRVQDERCADV